ncbi:MAG: energy transducer TonB [Bacteroidota bacterium]
MKFKEFIENNARGILGTLIFHLLLLNVFFILRMSALKSEQHVEMAIEFEELEENEPVIPVDKNKEYVEEELQQIDEDMARNIAVNRANENLAEEISTENYIDELKRELNIDELFPEQGSDEEFLPEFKEAREQEKASEEITEYSGPTRIEYYLENRTKRYIHVPVYKCEGSGKVSLDIVVDQEGLVVSANVAKVQGSSSNECLIDAALDAANRSRFNTDFNAPKRQKGTISYQFVAQ